MSRDRDAVDFERSSRSVFVGNIPYEATEERLKDLFSEVGTVVSFRLVFDRESGKPKGYGFAEYQDMETALSAMRNLNNRELLGRSLRVDHATSEKNRIMDDFGPMGGPFRPPPETRYGNPVPSQEAPEAISKAVASLPPEQMFELMKQMKQCIQNNPVEARNMLLQNPQLAYALLQAQVVMRIVDPEIAMKMLHRQNPIPNIVPSGEAFDRPPNGDHPPFMDRRRMMDENMDLGPPPHRRREGSPIDRRGPPMRGDERLGRGDMMGLGPRDGPMDRGRMHMGGRLSPEPFGRGPFGRPDMHEDRFLDRGPRDGIPGLGRDMGPGPGIDHGFGGPPIPPERGPFRDGGPPRILDQRGPVPLPDGPMDHGPMGERPGGDPRRGSARPVNEPPAPTPIPQNDAGNPDQEKAALIMQVLQLTPEQIAMLPEEQRKSILILKEQITGSGGR